MCLCIATALTGVAMLVSVPAYSYEWVTWDRTGHEYALIADSAAWHDQQDTAASLGASLVSVESAEENQWVLDNFGWTKTNAQRALWIGLYQPEGALEPSGGWRWVTGQTLAETGYANWHPGEPNNQGDEDYGLMNWVCGSPGTWIDAHGSAPYAAVMERDSDDSPEPATWLLVGLSAIVGGLSRRRRA